MPDETYRIIYEGVPDKANRGIDSLLAKLRALDAQVAKTNAGLRSLGLDTAGLTKFMSGEAKLEAALKGLDAVADKADEALKDVGKGNNSVGPLTKRLEGLDAELKQKVPDAKAAGDALRDVGKGVNLPGGGGGGGKKAGVLGAGAVMLGGMGAMAARAALRNSIAAVKDGLQDRVGFFAKASDQSAGFRESLREYASLRKQPGPNDKIMNEALDFGAKAGVVPDEITPFLTNYEGSATTGRDKGNIGGRVGQGGYTQAQQDALEAKLKVRGAIFATRTGLDARTAGDLTGVASTYARINSEADLAGQLGGMHFGLDQGRGEITPLARGELGQAGSSIESGRVSGLPELGAFIGVASVASKTASSAGTTYGQLSRFLNESGEGNDKQKAFIKESGIGAAKGDFAKLKALRDHLAKVKPDDANTYLESVGYGNSTDRRSALGMVGNVDVLEMRIAKAKQIAANGQAVIDLDTANQADPNSANRQGEVGEFAAITRVGMRGERLRAAESKARARMIRENRFKAGPIESIKDRIKSGIAMGSVTGEDIRVGVEANQTLEARGAKAGVDVRAMSPDLYHFHDPDSRARQFSAASEAVEAAEHARAAAASLNKMANAMNRPKGPPAPPPPGNGGAGALPARR